MNAKLKQHTRTLITALCQIICCSICILMPLATDAQKVGINVPTPEYSVHIRPPEGTVLAPFEPVLQVEYTGDSPGNPIAIRGWCSVADTAGYGGWFNGSKAGLVVGSGGSGSAIFGLHATASGYAQKAYGVYGCAANAVENWAGYFDLGDVYIRNKLGIGIKNPAFAVDILEPQAVMRFQSTNHTNGSVIDLRNTTDSPNLLGAINFATGSSTPGQISYLASDWLTLRAGGTERMRIGSEAIGINTTNPSHPVHITQAEGVQLWSYEPVLYVENIGTTSDAIAVQGVSMPAADWGIGGYFQGGYVGVEGYSNGGYAVRGLAVGDGTKYAVYGLATGTGTNWAGYFDGNTFTQTLGIGRSPITNALEVEGNASKSSAGDWIANSDARLKKNITPLDPETMIRHLLSLQGVTYEWNDTVTGSVRPGGLQYGFTAQNIREAFPTLVQTDNSGYLQTAYGTYDPMMVEAIRFLYEENQALKAEIDDIKAALHSKTVR